MVEEPASQDDMLPLNAQQGLANLTPQCPAGRWQLYPSMTTTMCVTVSPHHDLHDPRLPSGTQCSWPISIKPIKMAPSTKAAKAARRCPKPSLGSYSLGRQSVAPRCRYTPPPKARIKPMVASSTCAESTMAVPMSTLVPLMKFAAKAFKDVQGSSRILDLAS